MVSRYCKAIATAVFGFERYRRGYFQLMSNRTKGTPNNSKKAILSRKTCPPLAKKKRRSQPSLRMIREEFMKKPREAAHMELSQVLASVDLLQVCCPPKMQAELRTAAFHIINSLEMSVEMSSEQVCQYCDIVAWRNCEL